MSWWKDHGPKLVNGVSVAAGVLSGVDPAALPPSWLPWVMAVNAALNIAHNVQHNAVAPMPSGPPIIK